MRNSFCVIAALGLTLAAGGASAGTYDSSNSTALELAGVVFFPEHGINVLIGW